MNRPYRIVGQEQPTVAGGGVTILHTVQKSHRYGLIDRSWDQGTPFALGYDGASPKVYVEDAEPSAALKRWRVIRRENFLLRTNDSLNVPIPILSIPPDESLLEWSHLGTEGRSARSVAWWRKRISHMASMWPNEGLGPMWIPAGDYLTDSCQMLSEIQHHMLETVIDGGLTWSLWTSDEVLGYLNERISRFLSETGTLRTRANISLIAGVDTYELPQDLIRLRRVAISGSNLLPVTKWELDNGYPGWQSETPGQPTRYMIWPEDALTIRVVPTPDVPYTAVCHYVPNAPVVTSTCAAIPIPSPFSPGIKYGVMADMLSKQGEANDPIRAGKFETRYQEAVELAKAMIGVEGSSE